MREPESEYVRTIGLTCRGSKLSQNEKDELENAIETSPSDLDSRILLLSHYWTNQFNHDVTQKLFAHVSWVITNCPMHPIAGLPQGACLASLRVKPKSELLNRLKSNWLTQINEHCDNIDVLWNAAQFFHYSRDIDLAVTCLLKAKKIAPTKQWLAKIDFDLGSNQSMQSRYQQKSAGTGTD